MPLNLQGKVLRAIETKTVQRIGSTHTIPVDFRLITATNEDLAQLVEAKQFRADLYYRLNVIPIRLPPLRERREDIVPLANYFLAHFCQKYSKDKVFTPHTLEIFRAYLWPGNVRELRNVVERSVVMSMGRSIEISDLASFTGFSAETPPPTKNELSDSGPAYTPLSAASFETTLQDGVSLEQYLEQCERGYLSYTLQKYHSSYQAAQMLGTSQTSIMRRKKKYGL